MRMDEVRNQQPQVKMPGFLGKAKDDGAFGRIRPENLIEDGLEQQNTKGIQHADHRQKQHARQPFQHVGKPVAHQAQRFFHTGRSIWRTQDCMAALYLENVAAAARLVQVQAPEGSRDCPR